MVSDAADGKAEAAGMLRAARAMSYPRDGSALARGGGQGAVSQTSHRGSRSSTGRIKRTARRASVRRGVHLMRYTFRSHLAMPGAPGRAIQELAGHSELSMMQRYMHLSPAALDSAIRLLVSCP